jgi:L-fuconolactonase
MERMIASIQPTDFSRTQAPREAWLGLAPCEPALEPELSIVDTHMHLWRHQTGRYFAEDYERDVRDCGHEIEASVHIECRSMYRTEGPEHFKSVGETEFVAGMAAATAAARHTSSRIAAGIVGYADLLLHDRLDETLEAHIRAAGGRFRGIRQRAKWDADPAVRGPFGADAPGLLRRPEIRHGLAKLATYGLVFEASVFHPQIPDVTAMARAAPEADIVLIHSGSPLGFASYAGRESETRANWTASMRELAKCSNVSIKLGGLLMTLANFDFGVAARPPSSTELAELWRPYIEPCFELFGAERCMVASNFPVDKAGFGHSTVWNMFKRLTSGCSRDEKGAIFRDTAKRVYRL